MASVMGMIAIYLTPFLCIGFVFNSIKLAKQIKQGEENITKSSVWVTITFTLIVYSLVWSGFLSY
ncbi:hypothetical protein [Halobacillus seohaensis]|uniref:Uncharacterized protein n=1 Tax=Halobacillus seohaensis TaxID=447421 RepID=A0ABW2EPP4_9BACI